MKNTSRVIIVLLFCSFLAISLSFAQSSDAALSQIVIYKVADKAATASSLTGTGINGFKLTEGEELILMAKGTTSDGKEVEIWPTWSCDKELSVSVVPGRSKTVVVKALKKGTPLFITAYYLTDGGKKIKGEAMGTVIEKK